MHILCSSPFSFKARCKFCKGKPKYYFFSIEFFLKFKDYRKTVDVKNKFWQAQMVILNNHLSSVRQVSNTADFKSSIFFTKVSAKPYKSCRLNDLSDDCITDIATCECNRTTWSFKASENPLSKNRRSRINAPNKLLFL